MMIDEDNVRRRYEEGKGEEAGKEKSVFLFNPPEDPILYCDKSNIIFLNTQEAYPEYLHLV